jgi:hypothetical protein
MFCYVNKLGICNIRDFRSLDVEELVEETIDRDRSPEFTFHFISSLDMGRVPK